MTTSPDDLLALDAVLTDDERDTAKTVRAVLDEHVRPNVGRWYVDGSLPARDLALLFGELGLLGMHLEGYGCAGTTATMYGVACRELEAVDGGIRSLVSVQGSLAMYAIHAFGSEEQKTRWLPEMAAGRALGCFGLTEPDAGSDPSSMRTRARRDGTGEAADWVLDGAKMWITNAPVADVAVVWAKTEDGVRGFVVPTDSPGFSAPEIGDKLSLRASVTGQIVLEGVRLPHDAVLPGVVGLKGPLSCLTEARFGILWGVTGALRDSLTVALEYAATRVQFDRPIAGFQLTQAKFADAEAAYVKSVLLALHIGRVKDGEVPGARLTPEMISLGKMDNVRTALEVTRTLRSVLGGSGITADYSPLRHTTNLETVLTYEGTQEVHQLVVGKALTGLNAFSG
ncbi:acyl-CoA dehydrogenase family protein [Kineosporia sp. A_224]|uniref:acyl-CoA dehydrogenase family protein n=1 Tax=Kineosporia sp. A_224 TaxID=1962180 RepID=UPI000B4BA372|nr:acyl-CoA dehydrogenase family protein [Kineosporia sp. A_224]